jgi:hypothetical protein
MPDFKGKVVLDRPIDRNTLSRASREYVIKDTVLSLLEAGVHRPLPDGLIAGAGGRLAG